VKPVLPSAIDRAAGLEYALWLPPGPARAGIVILHGAGSCKESHYDFARAAIALDFAAIAFDARGHGPSDGPMDDGVLDDVGAVADVVRAAAGDPRLPVVLRGSSMGGYFALRAAERVDAAAVIAICPASAAGLRRGLAEGRFEFDADIAALDALLATDELEDIASKLEIPVLLLHAEGDESVPVQQSRELVAHLSHPRSRLIAVPGGHHRSVQHDPELQAVSLRFVQQVVAG
jgi:uncharacterized protein